MKMLRLILTVSLIHLLSAELRSPIIRETITKNLDYLESTGTTLSENATFFLVLGSGELAYLKETAPHIPLDLKRDIDSFRQRMKVFINNQLQTNDAYDVQMFFYPEIWVTRGDFRFREGRVVDKMADKEPEEIYGSSLRNDTTCYEELYRNQKTELESRSCRVSDPCMEQMSSISYTGPVSPDFRMDFLSKLRVLNCSEVPANIVQVQNNICSYIYSDVLKLDKAGFNNEKASIYLLKLIMCGTYGISEFYDDEIIQHLLDQVNEDGSVGNLAANEKEVVTAETAAVLSSVLRLKAAGVV